MTTGTTLIEVKQALRDAMLERADLSMFQISYGEPGTYATGDAIWFGPAESFNDPSTLGGRRVALDEIVTLTVYIQAFTMESEGFESADLRAVAGFADFQAMIAEKPQITENVMGAYVNSWTHHVQPADAAGSGYISRFQVQVQFRSILS